MKQTKKIGLTLAIIMIASLFAILPFPVAVQAVDGYPPNPPGEFNGNLTQSQINQTPYGKSLRVYGEDDLGPIYGYDMRGQFIYRNWTDPFDPAVLEKDVLIFNPAIVLDGDYGTMSAHDYYRPEGADDQNIHVKKYMRLWYEPEHQYSKEIYEWPTIEVETTYMLVNVQDFIPEHGDADGTHFVFPITEKPGQTGLGYFENQDPAVEPSSANLTDLVGVWANEPIGNYAKTVNGTIVLEKEYALDMGEEVQFLDHKLRYDYVVRKDGEYWAKVTVKYAGNLADDTARGVTLGTFDVTVAEDPNVNTYFDRHNNRYPTASHAAHRTWYARYTSFALGTYKALISVGKEISAGDTFYVNAVRYDVPAVEVLDTDGNGTNGAECFKYITLRTPLPKHEASVLVPDDGKVSSQWIDTIAPLEVIPLNPPFNTDHNVVDDINIVLWDYDGGLNWPCGTYDGPDSVGFEYWPWAERYLTMQYEEIVKEVHDVAGEDGENSVTVGLNWYNYFTPTPINRDDSERVLPNSVPALRFCYHEELEEPRYTTTLLEKLYEELLPSPSEPPAESWTWFDIQTRPSEYTAFALPEQPDLTYPGAINKTGDYILASAFLAPNSYNRSDLSGYLADKTPQGVPKMAFAFDPLYEEDVCTGELMGDGLDLYVNSYSDTAASIRVYGEEDIGPINGYLDRGTYRYPADDYQAPFKPQAIRKDSITFNPAIVQWDGEDYNMHAYDSYSGRPVASNDIDVKKYLRMWYEPEHRYSKNVEWRDLVNYTYPTIEIESTYLLIDSQDKLPIAGEQDSTAFVFPIVANRTTAVPGLEEFENPENPDAVPTDKNMVRLALVDLADGASIDQYNKTTWGKIRIEKTYQMAKGASVQFLDHELRYDDVLADENISIALRYNGNNLACANDGFTSGIKLTQENAYFGRHPGDGALPLSHPDVKWYARHGGYFLPYNDSFITVGMELQAGDVFYVDGVRYDVAAIEVIDGDGNATNGPELFKYITLRTPLPKMDDLTVDDDCVEDSGIMSSQWLITYEPDELLPVDPPFNKVHMIVDDVDVCPETYPDVADRIIGPYAPLNITYIAETIEPRYSSNLMEILWEDVTGTDPIVEDFTKFEIISRPDEYTEFVLPGDNARYDWENGMWGEALHNDYLVTTSFLANNSIGLAAIDAEDLTAYYYGIPRAAFVYDVINHNGVYVNEIVGAPPLPGAVLNVTCSVDPTETPSGFPVTACVRVPTAQANFPLTVTVDWGDGSADSVGVLPNNSAEICFEHIYFAQGIMNITQTARDIYGNTGVNDTSYVNVTNDGFKLVVGPGWNFFSIPVNQTDGVLVSEIFGPSMPSWLTTVYRWNEDGQNWDTLGWGDTVYPKYGYFVWGPASGTEEFIVTGTNEAFDDTWWAAYSGKWIAVGPGYQPQMISQWAYGWSSITWSYSPTHTLGVGNGYFVTV